MQAGDGINTEDALILRSMVEKIIVFDDRMSIHLWCRAKEVQQIMCEISLKANSFR